MKILNNKANLRAIIATAFLLVAGIAGPISKAHASWGELFCDIDNGSGSSLELAVSLYNNGNGTFDSDPAKRSCKRAIRFFSDAQISIPNGLRIYNTPPGGGTVGVAIRRCISDGTHPEAGCPSL